VATEPAGDGKRRSRVAVKGIVRVDWSALMRGFPVGNEVCEIAGIGPIPVEMFKLLMESGDMFLTALLTKGNDVASVVHLGRKATVYQETALQWLDPTCTTEGCANSWRLEIDRRSE